MLRLLPTLRFRCAFDILFRYEVMAHLEKIFGAKGLYLFIERFYSNSLWSEIILACHLVRNLEHPAHALYLLQPIDTAVRDSVSAWSICHRFTGSPARCELLIRAMKVWIPPEGDAALPFDVYPWLDIADLRQNRTLIEWRSLASETLSNHHFMRRWWRQPDVSHIDGRCMDEAIDSLASEEKRRLEGALHRVEWRRVMDAKRERKSKHRLKISSYEMHSIQAETARQHALHNAVLGETESLLRKMSALVLDTKFARIARIIACLAKMYPKIKWSLKLLFIIVSIDRIGFDVWYCERELCRQEGSRIEDPMRALRNICVYCASK